LSPSGEKITSVKDLMKGDYASLIALTRDDGLFTNICGVDTMDATFFSAPTTTTVGFAHDIVSEYFE
jgi:hypothetical protein